MYKFGNHGLGRDDFLTFCPSSPLTRDFLGLLFFSSCAMRKNSSDRQATPSSPSGLPDEQPAGLKLVFFARRLFPHD